MANKIPNLVSELKVNGTSFPVKVFLENRRSARVSITKSGILIRIPKWLPASQRDQQIEHFKGWAKKRIVAKPQLSERVQPVEYADGQILKVGEFNYTLRFQETKENDSTAKQSGDVILLQISTNMDPAETYKATSYLVYKIVAQHQKPYMMQRIKRLNEQHFQQTIRGIRLKNNSTNWGSCSGKGNINISARLLFAPEWVQDYVCIHELAHLIESNHSVHFWRLVHSAMPDYKSAEKWLKVNGELCRF